MAQEKSRQEPLTAWPFRELKTARLQLRPLQREDALAYLELFSDSKTMAFWSNEAIGSLAEAEAMLLQDIEWVESGDALCWGIALPETDRLVGKISLYFFSRQNRRAETGYILDRRYWRRGLMTEALGAVLDFAFDELDLHRVEADVDVAHTASLALLEKFGFTNEGLFRERWFVHGKWHDSVMLGLLAPDYKRRSVANDAS
ncbi:MAG: GNAT family protein, partial [Lysobacterales bacterium]